MARGVRALCKDMHKLRRLPARLVKANVVLDVLRIIVKLRLFELLNLFLHVLRRGVELLYVYLRCELGLLVVIVSSRAGGYFRLVATLVATLVAAPRLFPGHLLGLALAGRRRLLDVHGLTALLPAAHELPLDLVGRPRVARGDVLPALELLPELLLRLVPAPQRDVAGRAGHRRARHRRHGAAALPHPLVALLRRRGDAAGGEVAPVIPVLLVEVPSGLVALLVPVLHFEDKVLDRADLGEDDVDPVEVDTATVVC
mmetsp:Transcript_22305/g.51157  ORF Transcript_22305/g.51157 Transcript_22305/m.51157 type:complete len:257 (+) Transcript_22305:803-1573(+)